MTNHLKKINPSSAILAFLAVGVFFVEAIWSGWNSTVDDAFITFRYSDNLANGYGLSWNRGGPPTEGYTNFLLVLILAPLIKVGVDPLLATRILSLIALLATCYVIFYAAQKHQLSSATKSVLIASMVPLFPETFHLVLTGLETNIYSFALIIAMHLGVTLIYDSRKSIQFYFGTSVTLAMFLRPEAALAFFCLSASILMFSKEPWRRRVLICINSSLVPLTLGVLYLFWKYNYFGELLPNPYYLKVSGESLFSSIGTLSVSYFIKSSFLILLLLVFGVVFFRRYASEIENSYYAVMVSALLLILTYAFFFSTTDTIMDIYGRFLFPMKVVSVYGSILPIIRFLTLIEKFISKSFFSSFLALILILSLSQAGLLSMIREVENLVVGNKPAYLYPNSLMNKERVVAETLAEFPRISSTKIAFGDSGVIPYFTKSIWLDTVGLNDTFIAKTRDLGDLKDHLFGFQADLMIIPSWSDRWLQSGHGPLGDVNDWILDSRMSQYYYAGTVTTSFYDLEFFVRRDARQGELEQFLSSRVLDGIFVPFRLPYGGYVPTRSEESVWVPFRVKTGL